MNEHTAPSTVRLTLLVIIVVITLLTGVRLFVAWSHGSSLYHVDGTWITLARDLAQGVFYRPLLSEETGFGGTRYVPVFFVLHSLLILATGLPFASGFLLSALAVLLLVLGVFFLLRKLGVEHFLAVVFSALILGGHSVQFGLTNIRGDVLSSALGVWGLLMCLGAYRDERRLWAGAFFFTLAAATKVTAVHGPLAVFLWFLLNGRAKYAWRLAAYTALGFLAAFFIINLGSEGRFLEIMKTCASGGTTLKTVLKSPIVFFRALKLDTASLLFFFMALAAFLATRKRPPALPSCFLITSTAVTLFIFATPGTGYSHLVDLYTASIIMLAAALRNTRATQDRLQGIAVALAAVFTVFVVVEILRNEDIPHHKFRNIETVLASVEKSEKPLLSEDPLVPVYGGEQVRVMDAFMLLLMREKDPAIDRLLLDRIAGKDFRAVILLQEPRSRWYTEKHFGGGFIEAVEAHYSFSKRVGDYRVYLPRPQARARNEPSERRSRSAF